MIGRTNWKSMLLLGFLLCFNCATGWASGELDDLLGGFSDGGESNRQELKKKEDRLPDWLEVAGIIRLESTFSIAHAPPERGEPDYRGLSMLRGSMELIGDWHSSNWKGRLGVKGFYDVAYEINGERDRYSQAFLDDYEREFELNEVYIQGSIGENLDLKLGRQIVVWGKSDNIRITDILNPLDSRQPGLVDIRDLRLPVAMSKVDYYFGDWNFSTILVHEPRFDKTPVYNCDFYPADTPAPRDQIPVVSLENQQIGLALNGIFSGWDLSIYAASVFDARTHVEMDRVPVRKHERVLMTGFAANVARGNWLWKTEVAYWDGLHFSRVPGVEKSRLDLLGAFEYNGFQETSISFEIANRHIFDFDERLESFPDGQEEDLLQYAIRYVQNFKNDTLHFTLLYVSYDLFAEGGGFTRCQLEYDVNDALSVTTGVVLYASGEYLPFNDIGDNDRVLLKLEYRF